MRDSSLGDAGSFRSGQIMCLIFHRTKLTTTASFTATPNAMKGRNMKKRCLHHHEPKSKNALEELLDDCSVYRRETILLKTKKDRHDKNLDDGHDPFALFEHGAVRVTE